MVPSTGSCFIITEVDESPNSNFNIKVYPNPITDKELNIAFESPKNFNAQIIIYDIVGKEVYKEDVQNRQDIYYTHTVNVSDLPSGMYFINLIIDKNKVSTKFVKN